MHFIIQLNLSFGLLCRRKRRWLQLFVLIVSCIFSVGCNEHTGPTHASVFEGQNAFFEYFPQVQADSWKWFYQRQHDHSASTVMHNVGRYVIFVNEMRTASNLTVLNVTRADDQTKYHCARDGISSDLATLTVITPLDTDYPKCTIANTTDNIHVGKTVVIMCTAVGGIPRPSLQWFKNNTKLKEEDDFISSVSSTYFDILSISLSNEDNGVEFKCKADGISVVGNQSCSLVPLSIQPNVSIIVTKMSYNAGDSLNITCFGEGIPRISEYNWFFNNEHVTSFQSMFNTIENGTILEILELQTEHENAEIRCKVSIPSGLSANKSITLSFTSHDAATGDLLIYVVSGSVLGLLILLGLLVLCIKTKIKRNHEKKSKVTTSHYVNHDVSLNQVQSKEMNNDWYNKGQQPEHPIPMLESESVENVLYSDVSDIKQNQGLSPEEAYSLENISRERPDGVGLLLSTRSTEDLYLEPDFKHSNRNNPDTQSIDGIANFGDLYAEPIQEKHNTDTQLVEGRADFGDLYAKPIKRKQNPDTKSVDGIADFGDLYAKPIKQQQSVNQSEGLKDPNRPETESNTFSNNIELDFTYSSIA